MLGCGPTTPQVYPEKSGFAPRRERECGRRRHCADANRRPHPCASTSLAMTESLSAASRRRQSMKAKLSSHRTRNCMQPGSAASVEARALCPLRQQAGHPPAMIEERASRMLRARLARGRGSAGARGGAHPVWRHVAARSAPSRGGRSIPARTD
jgi:hypothetical protein